MRRTTTPQKKLIRSMINGSGGPMLRQATALDWVGDPFDTTGFVALHGENTYEQFLEHYREYTDVVGDHFLNLVATTLPTNAYLLTGDAKYRRWIVDYMDAWLRACSRTAASSRASSISTAGSAARRAMVGQRLRLGLQPDQSRDRPARRSQSHPARARRLQQRAAGHRRSEICGRVARDDRRRQRERAHGRRRTEYPTMFGADGWYGWQREPWSVGALEVWYWSMRDADRARVAANPWLDFLDGQERELSEHGSAARDREHPSQGSQHRATTIATWQTARRQHARSQPGCNRCPRAADAGRARARP